MTPRNVFVFGSLFLTAAGRSVWRILFTGLLRASIFFGKCMTQHTGASAGFLCLGCCAERRQGMRGSERLWNYVPKDAEKRKKRKNRAEKQGKKIENKSWNESEKKIQYYLTLGSVKKDEQGEINERQEEKNGGQKECRTQKIGTSAQL